MIENTKGDAPTSIAFSYKWVLLFLFSFLIWLLFLFIYNIRIFSCVTKIIFCSHNYHRLSYYLLILTIKSLFTTCCGSLLIRLLYNGRKLLILGSLWSSWYSLMSMKSSSDSFQTLLR